MMEEGEYHCTRIEQSSQIPDVRGLQGGLTGGRVVKVRLEAEESLHSSVTQLLNQSLQPTICLLCGLLCYTMSSI